MMAFTPPPPAAYGSPTRWRGSCVTTASVPRHRSQVRRARSSATLAFPPWHRGGSGAGLLKGAPANRARPVRQALVRKTEPDQGAPAGRGLGPDRTAVGLGHVAHDGEPEARAWHSPSRCGPVEAVEDMRPVSRRDARPSVTHGEFAGDQRYLHRLARRAELGRVVQQVTDGDL